MTPGKRWRRALVAVSAVSLAVGLGVAGFVVFWSYARFPLTPLEPLVRSAGRAGSGETRVAFLGDFAPTDRATPFIARHGGGYPFEGTRALVAGHDFAVANLEAPITASDRPWPVPKKYVYKIDPGLTPAIAASGVDAVTLANNHALDYGPSGLADTMDALDRVGLARLGAGRTEAEARRGLVIATPHGRLGVLSYAEDQPAWRLEALIFALHTPLHDFPGVARLEPSRVRADVAWMRSRCDVVVAVPHFGRNYRPVSAEQRRLAAMLVEAGADAVIGHHAHTVQPVGMHRGRPVVYSLGNWAFGTIGRPGLRFGMVATVRLSGKHLAGLELTPIVTQNRTVRYRSRPATPEESADFAKQMISESLNLGARLTVRGGGLEVTLR